MDVARRRALTSLAGTGLTSALAPTALDAMLQTRTPPGRLPVSEALRRQAAGDRSFRLSWLSFLPANRHANILDHRDDGDLAAPLQAMLDDLPAGACIYIPGRVTIDRGLTVRQAITLFGEPGRENFDNSWNRSTGGSQIAYRGVGEDVLRIVADGSPNANMNIVLRDFIIRGSRVSGRSERLPACAGRGIAVLGSSEHTANIRLDVDNVHVAEAHAEGLLLSGAVFGGTLQNIFLHRNGRAGLLVEGGTIGAGEFWMTRIRCFQNGGDGLIQQQRAGMVWRAGAFAAGQMSASENFGPGAILGGGPFTIGQLQLESNGRGRRPDDDVQLILGSGDRGVRAGAIEALLSAPSHGAVSTHIHIRSNVRNVRLAGFVSDPGGAAGVHVRRDAGATEIDLRALGGIARVVDRSDDFQTRVGVRVLVRAAAASKHLTGGGEVVAWRPDTAIVNDFNAYDTRTGVFTAPIAATYSVEAVIPLTGVDDAHRDGRMALVATSYGREIDLGNLAQQRGASSGGVTVSATARIPMTQGETLRVDYSVTGGARTVGTAGGNMRGFLTITAV